MTRAVDILWTQLPLWLSRRMRLPGAILADGRYLVALPPIALLAPVAAATTGFIVGADRPLSDQLFTFSVAWPAALLAFATLGAALGFWAWLGFAVGDFFFYRHVFFEIDPVAHLLTERLPLLILDEVLVALLVLLPIAAVALPRSAMPLVSRFIGSPTLRLAIGAALSAFVAALTAASWSASAQVLIRPFATFHVGVLGPQAVQPLRTLGSILILVAVGGTLLRRVLEVAVERLGRTPEPIPEPPAREPSTVRQILGSVVASVFVSVGLAGILNGPAELPVLFAIVLASALGRTILLPRIPRYAGLVNQVPALLRVVALGVAGYGIGQAISLAMFPGGVVQNSWDPVLVSVAISLAVATFVFPGSPIARRAEGLSTVESVAGTEVVG